ncbi:hypothetical protein IHC93_17230 [Photobacterium damselae subsp. damselae]|uniref:hypothetical protein n=1 Tax=Photobacterium damselae TaxID=38293 RepID=UPI001F3DE952|nr:hypothetical protein [Photobacterium damselae]UKA27756.1 hypothetical protein IHC93_17230 [Photobacterium damselae subsp. damselae]
MRFILLLFLFPLVVHSYTLDGAVTGKTIQFKNLANSMSGVGKVVISWQPTKRLLPVAQWAPGFRYTNNTLILQGPGGGVDLSNAIRVVGMEYKANSLTEEDNFSTAEVTCDTAGSSGDIAYVASLSGKSVCISEHSYNSENKMPFYFTRPILEINESEITNAFDSLENKVEGFYISSIPVNFVYGFEQRNGVKSWRNLTEILTISFYYKPNEITNIRLENPNVHDMKMRESNGTKIRGETQFNVIAEGYFNDGLRLQLVSSNNYYLSTNQNNYQIPFSIQCFDCDRKQLVHDGKLIEDGITKISGIEGTEIRFPINVSFDIDKDSVPVGDYYGQFTILFSSDI